MRNLFLLSLVLTALYLYMHPRTEPAPETATPVVARATPPPKLYYHSPLDASAMPTNVSTGAGYYSADPANSRFTSHAGGSVTNSSSAFGGYPVYSGGGGLVSNTVIYNGVGAGSALAPARQPSTNHSYVAGRAPTYPLNDNGGQHPNRTKQ